MNAPSPHLRDPHAADRSTRRDGRLLLAVGLAAVASAAVIAVVVVARGLRPLSDDYCLAKWGNEGFFGGVETVYRTWSGDLVVVASNVLFGGLPLAHLPWSLASVVPFFLGAASVGVATWTLLGVWGVMRVRMRTALLIVPVVMIAWWTYWWIPLRLPDPATPMPSDVDFELAASITFWQNINTAYVIVGSVWAVVLVLVWRRVDRPLGPGVVLWALLGLAVGLSGPVLALTFLGVTGLLCLLQVISRSVTRRRMVRYVLMWLGTLGGVAFSASAPGTDLRAARLTDTPFSKMTGLGDLVAWTVEGASRAWWGMLVGWSSLLVLLVAGLLGTLLGTRDRRVARRLIIAGGAMLLLSLGLNASSVLAEAFSYTGYWHLIMPSMVMFWALMCLGWGAASAVAQHPVATWSMAVAGTLCLVLGAGVALTDMTTSIQDRAQRWAVGPAPVGKIGDVEVDWVAECAQIFGQKRELPDRGPEVEQRLRDAVSP